MSRKQKLVDAAAGLFHRQGLATTTLADVASDAKVPLGSVYYYFNAKDDLVAAVAEHRAGGIERLIARLDELPDPAKRLEGLVKAWVEDRHIDALYGCPVGSFCFELARTRGPLSDNATRPFRLLLEWCESQFRLIGGGRKSYSFSLHLVSALQGISLTAAVFGEPELIARESELLRKWLRAMKRNKNRKA